MARQEFDRVFFSNSQFFIDNYYEPTRCDYTSASGGLIEYTKKGILRKPLHNFKLKTFESICSEITINKEKYCLLSFYRTERNENKKQNIERFFSELSDSMNKMIVKYNNIILMGDINIDSDDKKSPGFKNLMNFKDLFGLSNLIKQKTCFF